VTDAVVPLRNRLIVSGWSDLLANDAFRRYWIMRLVSHGANNALTYSLLVFTVRLSENAIATGALLLTFVVPSATLGALAGVFVDKLPRGLILLIVNLMRAVLAFLLIGAKDNLGSLYAVSLGFGILNQFAAPAEAAVVPTLVRKDRLTAANSFINLGTLVSQVIGMLILAPAFLKATDGGPLLLILVGAFCVAAVLLTLIPQFHFVTSDQEKVGMTLRAMRRAFAAGWQTVTRDSAAFTGLVFLVVASASTMVIATILPKFAIQVLGIKPENIVFVLVPAVFGVFLGLRLVEWIADRFDKLRALIWTYLLLAVSLAALGLVSATGELLDVFSVLSMDPLPEDGPRYAATILYANLYGFAFTAVMTMGRVLINERIPLEVQGRVFAAQAVLASLCAIPPVLAAGILADIVGVTPVMLVASLIALSVGGWAIGRHSRVFDPAP
jgi:MFS family permease